MAFIAVLWLFIGSSPAHAHGGDDELVLTAGAKVGAHTVTASFLQDHTGGSEWPIAVVVTGTPVPQAVVVEVLDKESGFIDEVELRPAPELGENLWSGTVTMSGQEEHLVSIAIETTRSRAVTSVPFTPVQASLFWSVMVVLLVIHALIYAKWLVKRAGQVWARKADLEVMVSAS